MLKTDEDVEKKEIIVSDEEVGKKKYQVYWAEFLKIQREGTPTEEEIKRFIDGILQCDKLGYKYAIFVLHDVIKKYVNRNLGTYFSQGLSPIFRSYLYGDFSSEVLKKAILKNPILAYLDPDDIENIRQIKSIFPVEMIQAFVKELEINKDDPYIKLRVLMKLEKIDGMTELKSHNNTQGDKLGNWDLRLYERYMHKFRKLPMVDKKCEIKFGKQCWIAMPDDVKGEIFRFLEVEDLLHVRRVNTECQSLLKNLKINHFQISSAKELLNCSVFPNIKIFCPTSLSSTKYELSCFNHRLNSQLQCCETPEDTVLIFALAIFKFYNMVINLSRNNVIQVETKKTFFDNIKTMTDLYNRYELLRQDLVSDIQTPKNAKLFQSLLNDLNEIIRRRITIGGQSSWSENLSMTSDIQTNQELSKDILIQLKKCYEGLENHINNYVSKIQKQTKCLVM